MPKSQNISDILGLETYPNTNIKTFKFGDRERNYGELEGTNLKEKCTTLPNLLLMLFGTRLVPPFGLESGLKHFL